MWDVIIQQCTYKRDDASEVLKPARYFLLKIFWEEAIYVELLRAYNILLGR